MFPHVITIYIYDEKSDAYSRQVVEGVYWTNTDNVPINEKQEHNGQATIIIPKELMNNVRVENGCFIARGEHPVINSITDLEKIESIKVSSIQVNDAGFEVDNITINGN